MTELIQYTRKHTVQDPAFTPRLASSTFTLTENRNSAPYVDSQFFLTRNSPLNVTRLIDSRTKKISFAPSLLGNSARGIHPSPHHPAVISCCYNNEVTRGIRVIGTLESYIHDGMETYSKEVSQSISSFD